MVKGHWTRPKMFERVRTLRRMCLGSLGLSGIPTMVRHGSGYGLVSVVAEESHALRQLDQSLTETT